MPRRPPRRTAYSRAVGRLGDTDRRWRDLSREEQITLTGERIRRFYAQAMDPNRTPAQQARSTLWFSIALERWQDLQPRPVPSTGTGHATPEALDELAARMLAPAPIAARRPMDVNRSGL